MDFINHFRNTKKTSKDLYQDFELAWAEYGYISSMIESKILEILKEDMAYLQEHGQHDNFYHDVAIDSYANIIITVAPAITISGVEEISRLLGTEGKIISSGTKKSARIKIIFEKQSQEVEYDKELEVTE